MNEIDTYLRNVSDASERNALEDLRKTLHELLPNPAECISYGMPAFRVNGKVVAGFSRFKNHLSFFPFSGTTLDAIGEELEKRGFSFTKSGVHFTPLKPLPRDLLEKIIQVRMKE